jgi:hypothetical protein
VMSISVGAWRSFTPSTRISGGTMIDFLLGVGGVMLIFWIVSRRD